MFYAVVQQFINSLTSLDTIIEKATKDAELRKFDVNNFVTARLAPDMFTFGKQVQVVTDVAKFMAALISGKEPPKYDDNETTIAELRGRIQKTVDYLKTFKESDFSDIDPRKKIKIMYPVGKFMYAQDAVLTRSIPNFYFHLVTAYDILRQGGVPIGKQDYLGKLNILDS